MDKILAMNASKVGVTQNTRTEAVAILLLFNVTTLFRSRDARPENLRFGLEVVKGPQRKRVLANPVTRSTRFCSRISHSL